MKVNEIFESIQGEGEYAGLPVLFIRLSGCTRSCSFCDTKYHKEGKEMSVDEVIKAIRKSKQNMIVWTGGEPCLQLKELKEVIEATCYCNHHLETNGDTLPPQDLFSYIAFSPKDDKTAKKFRNWITGINWDVKVVTDLKLNKNLIKYATLLMPLTTKNKKENTRIEQEVWNYCVKKDIRFCLRQHVKVWGIKRGK